MSALSDERLADVRARLSGVTPRMSGAYAMDLLAMADDLLAHVDHLTAENERLREVREGIAEALDLARLLPEQLECGGDSCHCTACDLVCELGNLLNPPTEASAEDIDRIADATAERWAGALRLMAEGPCDGCPTCPTEGETDHE